MFHTLGHDEENLDKFANEIASILLLLFSGLHFGKWASKIQPYKSNAIVV